jgi:aminopeptidase
VTLSQDSPVGRPKELFGGTVYEGGAVVLHALRLTVGDEAFFEGARQWVSRHLDGAATTDDFQDVMEDVSGQDLDQFFADWVDAHRIPSRFPD